MKPAVIRAAQRRVMAVYLHQALNKAESQPQQQSESQRHRRARIRTERKGMFALVERVTDEA